MDVNEEVKFSNFFFFGVGVGSLGGMGGGGGVHGRCE